MTVLGSVAELWVFPVKSMSGASLRSVQVLGTGLHGDRAWAVVDEAGVAVTAAQEPRLREVSTRIVDDEVRLDVPGAAPGLPGAAAAEALSAWLGRSLRLAHRDGTGFVDVAPVHIVSRTSIADAAHADQCDACDVSAPRANLVLDLTSGSERDWLGTSLAVGEAVLRVTREPNHCLGVYADVVTAGTVAIGGEVRVAP